MSRLSLPWMLVAALLFTSAEARQEPVEEPADPSSRPPATTSVRQMLDAAHEDLVELRFEKALASIAALIGSPEMSSAERAEALVLRAQLHVAFGDLDAAASDYREILAMRPDYRPDESMASPKAIERFERVRAELIGRLKVVVVPPTARLTLDGREVVLDADGGLSVLSGSYSLAAEMAGFDAAEQSTQVGAGEEVEVRLELVPNARSVIVSTDKEGVLVRVDSVVAGETRRPESSSVAPARLFIENLGLGEHRFELSLPCHRTERFDDLLTIDLLDREPRRFDTYYMTPARSTLIVTGGPEGAEVRVDGRPVGKTPLDPVEACPGPRELSVSLGDRVIWRVAMELPESVEVSVAISPRPNAALVGADDWPITLREFGLTFNVTAGLPLPESADLSDPVTWKAIPLPARTDLAVAVVPASRDWASDRWYLYSPILEIVQRLDVPPDDLSSPTWHRIIWGLSTVDSAIGGPAVVARLPASGSAARAGLEVGDRILSIGGEPVDGSGSVRARLAEAESDGRARVEWRSAGGETKEAVLLGSSTPDLETATFPADVATLRAAWAVLDSVCSPEDAAPALANLALLFSAFDRPEAAVEAWRRVRWGDRTGVGDGTSLYYLGRELQRLGRDDEAIEAFRGAAASAASAFSDEGPGVAPAAADRLADLGVSPTAR